MRYGGILLAAGLTLTIMQPVAALAEQRGNTSWYGRPFHNRTMANGHRYNMYARTLAHRTLPLGTQVEIRNLRNGRVTVGRVTDRGPYARGRKADVSLAMARDLDMVESGTALTRIRVLHRPDR